MEETQLITFQTPLMRPSTSFGRTIHRQAEARLSC